MGLEILELICSVNPDDKGSYVVKAELTGFSGYDRAVTVAQWMHEMFRKNLHELQISVLEAGTKPANPKDAN